MGAMCDENFLLEDMLARFVKRRYAAVYFDNKMAEDSIGHEGFSQRYGVKGTSEPVRSGYKGFVSFVDHVATGCRLGRVIKDSLLDQPNFEGQVMVGGAADKGDDDLGGGHFWFGLLLVAGIAGD